MALSNILAVNFGASGPRCVQVVVDGNAYSFDRQTHFKVDAPDVEREGFVNALRTRVKFGYDFVSIGAAGPVKDGANGKVCVISNLGYRLDANDISCDLGKPVFLCNDIPPMIAGASIAMERNPQSSFLINEGIKPIQNSGARIAIAPGTGLGFGYSLSDGMMELIGKSEAGHSQFAGTNFKPTMLIEELLLKYMEDKYSRANIVTWEYLLKGDAIRDILNFVRAITRNEIAHFVVKKRTPEIIKELVQSFDIPQQLDLVLDEGDDALSIAALKEYRNDLFDLVVLEDKERIDRNKLIPLLANEGQLVHCVVALSVWQRLLGLYTGQNIHHHLPEMGVFIGGSPVYGSEGALTHPETRLAPFTFKAGLTCRENEAFSTLATEFPIFGQRNDDGFFYGLGRLATSKFIDLADGKRTMLVADEITPIRLV